jgi:aerobic carbon-monoxide dehydrogenase large subunit
MSSREGNRGKYVGQEIRRKESADALVGAAEYLSDIRLPRMVYAALVRSPYAHARIKNVDLSRAINSPGVIAVYSGVDIKRATKPLAPFPFTAQQPYSSKYPRLRFADHYCLATDKVRHVGEAVAVVVAEDRYRCADAAAQVQVDYEPLSVLVDAEKAMTHPQKIYEEWDDNIQYEYRFTEGPVAELLRSSHLLVKETFNLHRYTGTPMEGRGVIADFNQPKSLLTVWDSTQIPHALPNLILESLGRSDVKIRVICPRIGGGFGIKWGFHPEEVLIPWLSLSLGRPVAWWETRSEHMVASHHSREQKITVEAGFSESGEITAIKGRVIVDLGVAYPCGGTSLAFVTANFIPGPYRVSSYEAEAYGVVTNKTASGVLRANGKVESNYVMERIMDMAARRLNLDRAEIRRRNFVPPEAFPYTCVTGSIYDSGRYGECLTKVVELAGLGALREETAKAAREGRYRGVGIGFMLEPLSSLRPNAYNSGYETAQLRVDPVGKAWVFSGDVNMGQAHQTTLSQIVADELGIDINDVEVFEGDTALLSSNSGSYACRFSTVTTSAAIMAARIVREKMLKIAGHVLKVDPERLDVLGGIITAPDGKTSITVKQVANIAYYSVNRLPQGMEPGLSGQHFFFNPNTKFEADAKGRSANFSTYPYAAHVAYVEVDPGTGEIKILKYVTVDDCGNQVNPMVVRTQLAGGIACGIGGAIYEELVYNEDGQLANSNFSNYLIPSILEMPNIELNHMITPMPFTPGGFKGAGEIGAIGPSLTLASAVEDALSPLGIKVIDLPLKPEKIWRLIHEAAKAKVGAA